MKELLLEVKGLGRVKLVRLESTDKLFHDVEDAVMDFFGREYWNEATEIFIRKFTLIIACKKKANLNELDAEDIFGVASYVKEDKLLFLIEISEKLRGRKIYLGRVLTYFTIKWLREDWGGCDALVKATNFYSLKLGLVLGAHPYKSQWEFSPGMSGSIITFKYLKGKSENTYYVSKDRKKRIKRIIILDDWIVGCPGEHPWIDVKKKNGDNFRAEWKSRESLHKIAMKRIAKMDKQEGSLESACKLFNIVED